MNEIRDILADFGKQSQDLIREALAKNRINASGRLSNSVSYSVKEGGFIYVLTVTSFSYIFSALQEGSPPPKKTFQQFRPVIAQWVKQKPGLRVPDSGKERFISATTNKILKQGTQLWVSTGSRGKTTGELEAIFSDGKINEVLEKLADKAENNIFDTIIKVGSR